MCMVVCCYRGNMMKLLIISDLHLEWGSFELPNDIDFDVLIFAGDLTNDGLKSARWVSRSSVNKGRPTIFVPGNHEYYREHMQAVNKGMKLVAQSRSQGLVHVLNPGEVIIDGVRFLGCTLWTDFELPISGQSDAAQAMNDASRLMNDFQTITLNTLGNKRRQLFKPSDAREQHRVDRAWLLERLKEPFAGQTVVITHHAPSLQSVAKEHHYDRLSACYASALPAEFLKCRCCGRMATCTPALITIKNPVASFVTRVAIATACTGIPSKTMRMTSLTLTTLWRFEGKQQDDSLQEPK